MKAPSILALLCIGCVVRYGGPDAAPTVPDAGAAGLALSDLDARVGLLLEAHPDEDQAERLDAARKLIRDSSAWSPKARDALAEYLAVVVAAEERAFAGTPGFLWRPPARVEEEQPSQVPPAPGGVREEPIDPPEPASPDGHTDVVPGDPEAWVRSEREAAGRQFLQVRALPDPEGRRRGLEDVRRRLTSLLVACPDSPYAEAIRRNLATVEREIERNP
ncbi:MAG: hypothetical protein JXB39_07795 [Deltaproteobacteria bacterium]|nr:hypothetical protein [Deltaproteobacteria bacterium]